jgi:hypothetical protein
MRRSNRGARFTHLIAAVAGLLPLLLGTRAHAAFHLARIDELMVGYDGDASVQFVEVRMLTSGQNFVDGVQLAVFDATGAFAGTVLTMDHDVDSGTDRRWLIGTAAFAAASGVTPDFMLTPGLPSSGGGMVCVGRPTQVSNPARYVDCVSYGAYTGPANTHTSAPNPLIPNGFSLQRGAATDNSAVDFTCSDPADPEANNGATADLAATTPCPSASTTTTTIAGGTTTTTSGQPAPVCGDGTDDGEVTATDALLALNTSVGTGSCVPCRCDVNGSGGVTATDALVILNAAVGVPVTLGCPGC